MVDSMENEATKEIQKKKNRLHESYQMICMSLSNNEYLILKQNMT